MIRAVVKNGTIQPLEPIPPEWSEGREVVVQETATLDTRESIDRWYQELEALCAAADPEDDQRLRVALAESHEHAKARVRREMGHE
jgi:hypothetical protein